MHNSQLPSLNGISSTSPHKLVFWAGHFFCLVLVIGGASFIAWGKWFFWQFANGLPMSGLGILAYLIAALASRQFSHLPRLQIGGMVLLVTTVLFLIVLSTLAFGRLYYSRSFLLFAYIGTFLAVFSSARGCWLKNLEPRFAVVPGGISEELYRLNNCSWDILSTPQLATPVDGVIVDLHKKLSPAWIRFLSDCSLKKIPVYHSAVFFEAVTGRISLSHLSDGLLEDFQISPLYMAVKRAVDVLIVLFAAPVVIPLCLLVGLIVRLETAGPVFFRQARVGQGGEVFIVVKFRSMRVDAEQKGPRFASEGDSRITRVGRFIRRFRLDELPQFWNILKGEMSLVGPRPEQVAFVEKFNREIPFYAYRHMMKPGLSGWAQICQGYADDVDQTRYKLGYDLFYIKHFSLWLDFWILLKTLKIVVSGSGVR